MSIQLYENTAPTRSTLTSGEQALAASPAAENPRANFLPFPKLTFLPGDPLAPLPPTPPVEEPAPVWTKLLTPIEWAAIRWQLAVSFTPELPPLAVECYERVRQLVELEVFLDWAESRPIILS